MAVIQFYHLTTTPLERALPKLMEKVVAGGFKALLVADSEPRLHALDELLWAYDPVSFMPHAPANDEYAALQPILLSDTIEIEPANKANLLVVTDGSMPADASRFARILDIFDSRDGQATEQARTRWSSYKSAGHELTYLRQTEQGGWQQPAKSA